MSIAGSAALRPQAMERLSRLAHHDMPAPSGTRVVEEFEARLADTFEVAEAVAVSAGTAALHLALLGCGIGPGDEVLVPSVSVPMSVAAVTYCGARPILVDADPTGYTFDYPDLVAKTSPRTRAILAVHIAGRCPDLARLADYASTSRIALIEDACQAQGSRYASRWTGSFGRAGCFSLKDGKILWSGEGGYILTNDPDLAAWARAARSHMQLPNPTTPGWVEFGYNYRLAEPLAALATANLERFETLLERRRQQTAWLIDELRHVAEVHPVTPTTQEAWNGYSPLFWLNLPKPRAFCRNVAAACVPNSVGTYGLTSAHLLPAMGRHRPTSCPRAASTIDNTLAVIINDHDNDADLTRLANIITTEAQKWS